MSEQIEMLRGIIHRLIIEMETFPDNQDKSVEFFGDRVIKLRTTIAMLSRLGDHNFTGLPLFSFNNRLLNESKTKITGCGYRALRSYLDSIKPSLNNPIAVSG